MTDLSAPEIERARAEAGRRGLDIALSVCDVRQVNVHHGSGFDIVISCDNSLPHLLTDDDLALAFRQMLACLAVGGGCIVTVRDYAREERGRNLFKPYGVQVENGKRYLLSQVWDFDGDHYDLTFFVVEEDLSTGQVETHAMRSRYYAVSTDRLCELMRDAGFRDVRRIGEQRPGNQLLHESRFRAGAGVIENVRAGRCAGRGGTLWAAAA